MTNMTLAIPEDLHSVMKQHSEIKWSEVARKAIRDQVEKLRVMDKILKKSNLSKIDSNEIGELIKDEIAKRHNLSNRHK